MQGSYATDGLAPCSLGGSTCPWENIIYSPCIGSTLSNLPISIEPLFNMMVRVSFPGAIFAFSSIFLNCSGLIPLPFPTGQSVPPQYKTWTPVVHNCFLNHSPAERPRRDSLYALACPQATAPQN